MPHPYPDPNITSVMKIVDYSNTVTEGWYLASMIIMFNLVTYFIISRYYQYKYFESAAASFMLGFFITGLLAGANLIPKSYVQLEFSLMVILFVIAYFNKD